MGLAKLDCYHYHILPGVVQIELAGTTDPSLVDILSEIDCNNGRVYVEGQYFLMTDHCTYLGSNGKTYLNLSVTTLN